MSSEPTNSDVFAEIAGLPSPVQEQILSLYEQAMAYVWGWQDAGGKPDDPNYAPRFAAVYGIHAARHAKALISFRVSLQSAWVEWKAGRPIERRRG